MGKSMESRDHHYILEPVCASALLRRNCSKEPLRSRHTPRFECDIQLETIPLKLSQVPPFPQQPVLSPSDLELGWMSMSIEGPQDFTAPSRKEGTQEVVPTVVVGVESIVCSAVGLGWSRVSSELVFKCWAEPKSTVMSILNCQSPGRSATWWGNLVFRFALVFN